MITVTNYTDSTKAVDINKMPKAIQEGHKFMSEFADLYNDDADIKKAIDNHVKMLNEALAKKKDDTFVKDHIIVTTPPKHKFVEPKVEPKPKKEKAPKEIIPEPEKVHHLDPEVRFIKRYAILHSKVKSRDELLSFLHTLQKAINDKTITKKSQYASEITDIQNGLVKAINACKTDILITIDEDNLHKYQSIARGQKVIYSIPIIKNFIMLSGKPQVKDKSKALLNRIQERAAKGLFKSDPHSNEVKAIQKALEDYINGKDERVTLPDISLRGLYGLAGIEPPKVNLTPGKVISSSEFVNASFTLIGFDGQWKKLIGTPQEPFKIMIYGKPGCGKSSLALRLAHYLASKHNQKVLAVCKEEGFNYTVKEKLDRLNIAHPNLFVTDQLPTDLTPYNTILIDSVNSLNIDPSVLQVLYKKYPKQNWIEAFQTTKEGNFKGEQEYSHDVDTVILCEDMIAYPEKNRFGGKESIKIA